MLNERTFVVALADRASWLHNQKRILHPGDSVFIPADVVHASFNTGSTPAKLMAILGPCVGDGGYVSVEVGDQEPWKGMR